MYEVCALYTLKKGSVKKYIMHCYMCNKIAKRTFPCNF